MTEVPTSSPSALTDIHQLIESHNPFDRNPVVRAHDVWNLNFPDVPSINGHISDAVFQGIEQIRAGTRSVLGITIRAERGFGKSHLMSRIRNRLKQEDETFFVYASESDYSDLDQINSLFLTSLAQSLKQTGSKGVMQWQELATLLVNEVYKSSYTAEELIKRFPSVLAKHPNLVDQLTAKICQLKPDIRDPYVPHAIVWTLAPDRCLFAINWLAGRELSQAQANAMGLPILREDDREKHALGIASQILDLVGEYRTIIICFDEVEPKATNSKGLSTPQVVAALAKDLYSKIKRGILMMSIYPVTWSHQVKAMPQAEAVIDRIGEKVFDLTPLNSDNIVNLVSTWLAKFYSSKGLTPPSKTYPFSEDELRDLGKERPIIREVLNWCGKNWGVPDGARDPKVIDELHKIEIAFQEQLAALDGCLDDYLEESAVIAYALFIGFWAIEGQKINSVFVETVEDIEVKAVDQGYLSFRVIGEDNGQPIDIGVCVLQESGGRYVSAALKRLIDYEKFGFTRGCLVRSKAVNPNTKGHEYLNTLLSDLGGEWVTLKGKDIQPLLAMSLVFEACEEYDFTEEQVLEFIRQRKIAESNYLIREILSDPSGDVPDNVIDEDTVIENNSPFDSDADEEPLPTL